VGDFDLGVGNGWQLRFGQKEAYQLFVAGLVFGGNPRNTGYEHPAGWHCRASFDRFGHHRSYRRPHLFCLAWDFGTQQRVFPGQLRSGFRLRDGRPDRRPQHQTPFGRNRVRRSRAGYRIRLGRLAAGTRPAAYQG